MRTVSIISPPPRNGGSCVEQLALAPEHADAGRADDLVAGEDHDVGARRRPRRPGSCGAACEASTTTIAPTSWALRAISATGLIVPSMLETQVSVTTLVRSVISSSMLDRSRCPSSVMPNHFRLAPVRSVRQLPRHDVGVVLHLGGDDHVALADLQRTARPRQRVGHQVERLGGVLGEDHLVATGRVDERRHPVAALLERLGRLRTQRVHGARDVGVVPLQVVDHRVDDHLRLLRGVGAVEVDQRQTARDGAARGSGSRRGSPPAQGGGRPAGSSSCQTAAVRYFS